MSQKQINPRAKELVEICQQVLDVELGAIVASRKIQSLAFELYTDYGIPKVLDPFIGIGSQTDHLPVGPERRHWSTEALQKKDLKITECELFFWEVAIEATRKTIEVYAKAFETNSQPEK